MTSPDTVYPSPEVSKLTVVDDSTLIKEEKIYDKNNKYNFHFFI